MMDGLKRYLRPTPKSTSWLWLSAAIGLAAAAWLGLLALQQYRIVEQAATRNDKLATMQNASKTPTPGRAEQENLKRWTQLKMERDFPWAPVFQAVEKVTGRDIELLEFKPDKLNRTIALGGEAKDRKALVAYLAVLSTQRALKNVYLVHQQSVERGALETVAFEIRATLGE
jgi:Tfp pilus assembly protein PilN